MPTGASVHYFKPPLSPTSPLHLTTSDTSDLRYAVYVWQGRHCASLEAGAAAVMAADLHKSRFSGRSTLVRVEQGLEPAHFVRLFK